MKSSPAYSSNTPPRIVTATAIFDGHDAAINLIRRLLQERGAEIIHLGHNRSVEEIVQAAIQEDVQAIAVSSYQGGHREFFSYLQKQLRQKQAEEILILGGGGGTISQTEARQLEKDGVHRIYTADDVQAIGLESMADEIIQSCQQTMQKQHAFDSLSRDYRQLSNHSIARLLTGIEQNQLSVRKINRFNGRVIGITGTGGSGKSTLIDEILQHLLKTTESFQPEYRIAYIAMDPSRQKTGGALLGDRIRINAAPNERLLIRSLATRIANRTTSPHLESIIELLKQADFNLIILETAGIGQSDASVTIHVDESIYVMTKDYGAPSQLEKIAMLDEADCIVLNKYAQSGSEDALRDITKQWRRNHKAYSNSDSVPIFPLNAGTFNDPGLMDWIKYLLEKLNLPIHQHLELARHAPPPLCRPQRENYLSEIARLGKERKSHHKLQIESCLQAQHYYGSLKSLGDPNLPPPLVLFTENQLELTQTHYQLRRLYQMQVTQLDDTLRQSMQKWLNDSNHASNVDKASDTNHELISGKDNTREDISELSRSHLPIPQIAHPNYQSWGGLCDFLLNENLPGQFPFTGGVYPRRQDCEEPTRMFAGEGIPEDTNHRFFYLLRGQKSIRLSTAFDPISLYGQDPQKRQDIFGCIGMSGVSVASLDDMKKLYSGIDLNSPQTSVSMTINGPAPIFMAWFIHTAIDQRIETYLKSQGRWHEVERFKKSWFKDKKTPEYQAELPPHHSGLGLGLLGISGQQILAPEEYQQLANETMHVIRGTLQADILKEEMAQNECLFSLPFSLQLMADVQQYFIHHQVKNFYSVSVSGYHIAEAGANPVTQLAFTLANGFTLLEYYLAQGMQIDEFAHRFSFFFSNGMDPEYAVIGRVARRIWAHTLRDYYQAEEKSQKLKYHIQTSGRSLHAQEIELNDIRTTLQAQYALNDSCNSLHTNAYDEAVTTPTEESVRRALAIQMIIQRELGLNINQNPLQGSYIIRHLTDHMEQAVYDEFERLNQRGGVLGGIENFYQRSKIQDESRYYEGLKNSGKLPIVGVNTYMPQQDSANKKNDFSLTRCSDNKKLLQIQSIDNFKQNHRDSSQMGLDNLQSEILHNRNSFNAIMAACTHCTLGQLTHALNEVGGAYRRKM